MIKRPLTLSKKNTRLYSFLPFICDYVNLSFRATLYLCLYIYTSGAVCPFGCLAIHNIMHFPLLEHLMNGMDTVHCYVSLLLLRVVFCALTRQLTFTSGLMTNSV